MSTNSSVSSVTATSSSSTVKSTSISTNNSSDYSFKDEMSKVSKETKSEEKDSVADKNKKNVEPAKKEEKNDKVAVNNHNEQNKNLNAESEKAKNLTMESEISINQFTFSEINNLLANNIQEMVENSSNINSDKINQNWMIGFGSDSKNSLKMTETDADFFLSLTKENDVSLANITATGQTMVNNGVEASQVKQNMEVSQTLLNALKEARENNQPLRIDFDKNISVILRVNREGMLSAQFIPGDKVAEQYLKSNIESLKSAFDEQDLPYSELSYSNASKEQNRKRREEKRQGE